MVYISKARGVATLAIAKEYRKPCLRLYTGMDTIVNIIMEAKCNYGAKTGSFMTFEKCILKHNTSMSFVGYK